MAGIIPPSTANAPLADEFSKEIWKSTQKKFQEGGRWLIAEKVNEGGYQELIKKVEGANKRMFKGTFVLHNFPANIADKVDFLMTDKEATVGQIKEEVAKITSQSAKDLKLSFKGFRPLDDNTDLYYGLNCHGRGGENFQLTLVKPDEKSKQTLSVNGLER